MLPIIRIEREPKDARTVYRRVFAGIEAAARRSVHYAIPDLRRRAQSHTGAILGKRGSRLWGRAVFYDPAKNKGSATMAAGVIPSRAPDIIRAHEFGGTFVPREREALAIPLPAAGRRGFGRFNNKALTPKNYEKAFGVKLIFRPLPSGNAMLLDPTFRTGTRRTGESFRRRATARQRERGIGLSPEPVFILVRSVSLQKRLRLTEGVLPRSGTVLAEAFGRFVTDEIARRFGAERFGPPRP